MTPAKPTVQLEHYLRQLKWPALLRECAALVAACTQGRSNYASDLLRLVERDVVEREHLAAGRRIKAAGFPVLEALDTFDFTARASVDESLVRELMRVECIAARENDQLAGNGGTGKTHGQCA